MIASFIPLLLGAVSLWAVCLCKAEEGTDRYLEKLEHRKEFDK